MRSAGRAPVAGTGCRPSGVTTGDWRTDAGEDDRDRDATFCNRFVTGAGAGGKH